GHHLPATMLYRRHSATARRLPLRVHELVPHRLDQLAHERDGRVAVLVGRHHRHVAPLRSGDDTVEGLSSPFGLCATIHVSISANPVRPDARISVGSAFEMVMPCLVTVCHRLGRRHATPGSHTFQNSSANCPTTIPAPAGGSTPRR